MLAIKGNKVIYARDYRGSSNNCVVTVLQPLLAFLNGAYIGRLGNGNTAEVHHRCKRYQFIRCFDS